MTPARALNGSLPLLFLLLAACEPKEEGPPDLALSATALELGEVPLGETATATLTLTNAGGGSLEILSASLVDGDDEVWRVDRAGVDTIAAGASAEITITFEPDEQGLAEGSVQVRSSDEDEGQVYVSLSGTGAPSTTDRDGDGYSPADGDCDDGNAARYPGNDEACDGVDNDCDGTVPSDEKDADYDGFRLCQDDCDDADSDVYPDAPEICDDKDSDCDGVSADHDDLDDDGYAVCDGDCDDHEDAVKPGAAEICDDLDNDCSGLADDLDEDGDGHSPCGDVGDCDDDDASAFPVVVDVAASDGGDGTEEDPFNDLDDALGALDTVCRTAVLLPGTYTLDLSWTRGTLTLQGGGATPDAVVLTAADGDRVATVSGGADLTLMNLTLSGATGAGDGGAVWASAADLTLIDVVATGNTSTGDGGAVAVNGGTLTLDGCTFTDNLAGDDGGAIAVVSGDLVDAGSTYEGNQGGRGGAILLEGSSADLSDFEMWSNTSTEEGGGIALAGAEPLDIRRGTLALNQAGTRGGALSFTDIDDVNSVVRNLFIQDNEAALTGGGVSIAGGDAAFVFGNNTLTGNMAGGEGGGLSVEADDASAMVVWSNLVIASFGDSGLYVAEGAGASVAWCTAYLTASGVEFGGEAVAGSNDNTEENPLFTSFSNDGDPDDDDLSLRSTSPARNSGPDTSIWDDVDGSTNDRGATGGPEASP